MNQQRNSIEVEGTKYDWWVSRNPQWCHEDGWQGGQLTVELADSPRKQLLIQFPFVVESRSSTPHKQRPKIPVNVVVEHIKKAIGAGWEPDSKGKPFRYEVE